MAFVQGIVYKRLSPGQTLTIFGGFIDGSCSVYFGATEAAVVDYDEDKIEVVVPIAKGDYKVTLRDGDNNVIDVGNVSVVGLAATPKRFAPKDYTKADFINYVLSLMPRGKAFALWNGSNLSKLVSAIADALKYTWNTIQTMVDAVDPTHTENFSDWEGELNLPVIGIYPQTTEGRRAEIYRAECTNGGCSKGFVKHILFLMGIDADVYEYTQEPEQFDDNTFGQDEDPRFFMKIVFKISEDDVTLFRSGESCSGDYLLDFGKYKEEAVFEMIKQSHIKIIYGYRVPV